MESFASQRNGRLWALAGALALAWLAGDAAAQPPPEMIYENEGPPPRMAFTNETVFVDPAGRVLWNDDPNCPCGDCLPCIEPRPTPLWSAYVDGLFLMRDQLGNEFDFATLNGGVVLGTENFQNKFEGGLRGRIARRVGPAAQIEAVFFGLQEWDYLSTARDVSDNGLGSTGNMMSPFTNFGHPGTVGLDYNTLAAIRLQSRLDNFEINLTHICPTVYGPAHAPLELSVLAGVRWMRIGETFGYYAQSNLPAVMGSVNQTSTGVRNDLYAGQLGGVANWFVKEDWWFNFEIKAALAQNEASQNTVYTNINNGVTTTYVTERSQGQTAFIGDLILTSAYQPTEFLTFRAGYQATFVEGLAVGSENFNSNLGVLTLGPGEIRQNATVVYHGPFVGIEFSR